MAERLLDRTQQEPPRYESGFRAHGSNQRSTGSSATLSHGLKGTKPHRRRSDGSTILIPQRRRRKPSRPLSRKCVGAVVTR